MYEITSVFQLRYQFLNETDKERREELLELMSDESFLKRLLEKGSEFDRTWAISMIKDQTLLKKYAVEDKLPEVRRQALLKIEDEKFLKDRVLKETHHIPRTAAMSKINDPDFFYNIAVSDEYDLLFRDEAIGFINDENLLAKGIIDWKFGFANKAAFITSGALWCKIYFESIKPGPKILAAKNIQNINMLITIASTSDNFDVRQAAIDKITRLTD